MLWRPFSAPPRASMRFHGREATVALLTDTADDLARKPLEAGCSAKLQLDDLLRRFPMEWEGQRSSLGYHPAS